MESDDARIQRLLKEKGELKGVLLLLLDQVDYTAGNCTPTELVGAVLDKSVIARCKETLAAISVG